MTTNEARKIIETAYSQIMDAAQSSMSQGARYEIDQAFKAEVKESRNPSFTQPKQRTLWAKAGIVGSIVSGASGKWSAGDLYGIRDAHVKAMIIGARYAAEVNALGIDGRVIEEAKAQTW